MADLNVEINDNNNIVEEEKLNPCRCPECHLIPLITMYKDNNNNLKLKFICSNNHEFNEDFKILHEKSKLDFDNINCKTCNIKKLKNKLKLKIKLKINKIL